MSVPNRAHSAYKLYALFFNTASVLESYAEEVVEVSSDTVITVVTAVYIVPDMRNAVLLKAIVIASGIVADSLVIASCGYHQEVWLIAAVPLE